jgi:hypothetical protein
VLGDVALHEHRRDVGVEADREHHRGQFQRRLADHPGRVTDRERVQIDDAVEDIRIVLSQHPVAEGAEVVPQLHLAGWLDTRQHSGHGARLTKRSRISRL